MDLKHKIEYLYNRLFDFDGYMVQIITTSKALLDAHRLTSIGHNAAIMINRAYHNLTGR